MCEDVGDRKGMKKEGQRRRTQEKRRETEKKMGRKREGRARKRGKAEEGKSVRRKKALRPGGHDCFMKHHGGRGQTNGGGSAPGAPRGDEAPWAQHGRSTGEGRAGQRSVSSSSGLFVTFVFR